jgi:hypothetical protein
VKKGVKDERTLDLACEGNEYVRRLISEIEEEVVKIREIEELYEKELQEDEGYILEERIFRLVKEKKILSRILNLREQLSTCTKDWTESKMKRIIKLNRK